MNLYPTAPQSIGKVLDSGFSMFRAVLKPMLPLSFVAAFIAQLPGLLPYVLGRTLAPAGGLPSFAGIGVGIVAFFIVWFVAYIAFYAGWMKSLDALARGGTVLSFGGAFTAGLPKVLPMIGATIGFTLAVCIGTLLLVIPGIILTFSLVFFTYLVMLEDKGPIDALKTSHSLVWGNWWRTVTVITVGAVIYCVAVLLVLGPVGAVIGISAMGGPTPEQAAAGLGAGSLVIFVLQVALTTLILPMWNSLMLVTMRDLQLRKAAAPAGSS